MVPRIWIRVYVVILSITHQDVHYNFIKKIMHEILLSQKQYGALLFRLDALKEKMNTMQANPGSEDQYITNEELMRLLRVSRRTVLRWRETYRLPYIKIGRKLYYNAEIILNSFRMHPNSPPEAVSRLPDDPEPEAVMPQMECERCPLFVLLNQ